MSFWASFIFIHFWTVFLGIAEHKNVIKADRLNIKMEHLNVLNGVQLEIHSILYQEKNVS